MCFGGKGGGGNQGGGSSQEDAEIRRSHSKAGISAAETRRHFRERDNPAHSRNENAAGATKSVSHSRDEGGNLVSQRVEYGQGNFADGSMKAENILGKRDDVRQIGNDLNVGGKIFSNARLSKSGNSIISTDPNNVGTIGGITSGGGLWGGREVQSALGVGAQDSRGIATGLVTPVLDEQRRSRTAKYQAQSDLFKNSTPEQIEAIRAANRAKNPADRDGDGSWLTSTDNMGRVAGIGSRGDGSGAQPYIFDPTLGKEYQALPQLDPNRGADTNLTMFGKGMRTAGKAVAGALVPGAGALMLLDRFSDKIPSFLTGGDAPGSANDQALLRQEEQRSAFPVPTSTRFATSDQNAPNPFSETSSTSTLGSASGSTSGSALSRIQSPYPRLRPASMNVNTYDDAYANQFRGGENIENYSGTNNGMPTSRYLKEEKMNNVRVDGNTVYMRKADLNNDANFNQLMPPSTTGGLDPTRGDIINFRRNNQQYIDMGARGEPMNITIPEAGSPSRYVNYALNESGSDDNNSYSDGVPIQPVIAPSADYAQWMPNSGYIGASSYGGPFSSASQNFASVLPPSIYSTGGSSNSVPTRFVNDRTKQYFTAPNDSYYAEENSDWRQANPYSLA